MTQRLGYVALGVGAIALGASLLAIPRHRGGIELVRVNLRETLMEPCRFPLSRDRNVVVVGVGVAPAAAQGVDSIEISGALGDYVVARQRQMCEVRGQGRTTREACIAEACDSGTCTIRIPIEADTGQAGTVRVRSRSGDWGPWGASSLAPAPPAPPAPALEVTRERDTVGVAGAPGTSMRVSVLARGRVLADSPLSLGDDGKASFKVPPGTERALVAASLRGSGGVSQSTVHVAAPFDDACESP